VCIGQIRKVVLENITQPYKFAIAIMELQTIIIVVFVILVALVACALVFKKKDQRTVGGQLPTHALLPAGEPPHEHQATLGPEGVGESTTDQGHSHPIEAHAVQSSGPDPHTHDITQFVTDKV